MIRGLAEDGLAWVNANVGLPSLANRSEDISFLVDTGATVTVLMPADLRRLGIDPAALFPDVRSVAVPGFGGDIRMIATIGVLRFDDEASPSVFTMPVGIVQPSSTTYDLPSVLGMDFVQHFRLTVSIPEDRVEIERIP